MNLAIVLLIPIVLSAIVLTTRFGRAPKASGSGRLDIGEGDLERLPERIRLLRAHETTTYVPYVLKQMSGELKLEGFEDAGVFTVEGMPEVTVQLLVHPGLSLTAALFDHRAAGTWPEFTSYYPDGAKVTFTTLTGSGLEPRPEHTVVRLPSATLLELYARACNERPMGVLMPVHVNSAPAQFELGYAQWRGFRHGVVPAPVERSKAA